MDDDISLVVRAMKLVMEDAGKVLPKVGSVECPKCKGTLRYVIQGPRAHRGKCDTDGCLHWIG